MVLDCETVQLLFLPPKMVIETTELCNLLVSSFHEKKEGNVLFNNAFNTFYLPLYGIGHMVKDH